MKEQILEILKKEKQALDTEIIASLLGLKTVEEIRALSETLIEMEKNLQIRLTNKKRYMIYENSNLKVGMLSVKKRGFGFVDIEGDIDVHIAPINMNGAIHGDKVIVEITSTKNLQFEGRIVKVMDRNLSNMVGEFYYENGRGHIDLDDDRVKITIEIDNSKTQGAMNGHKVLVKVTDKIKENRYTGEVVKVLGHKNDPGVDILSIAYGFGINPEFSEEIMKEVDAIPNEVKPEEMINRRDLREKEIYTIDGDDTKDIDDALSIEKLPNGNIQLGVHIADVSYYVKEGSNLDEEAYSRGTSVYLADRVVPMLPHKLSNGICSLNPGVDRLAISCEMEINTNGEVVNYDIFESVIRSQKQMTYKNVNQILEQNIIPEGYEPYVNSLNLMAGLAKTLRKMKEKRGYIDFDIDESKIIVNDKGEAVDVVLRERGVGEKLIEDFMIAANETVATHIYFMELPFVYRIHGEPNEEKIHNFIRFISVLGYKLNGKVKDITPVTMQKILDDLKDKKEFHILSALLLRSMQKAVYDSNNIGHFGLASKIYTHFTSPIRRYPDTTVHRLLRTYLFNNNMDVDTIAYWENKLPFLTKHASERERAAVECEREVDNMKKAEYMSNHIGEKYTGIVSGVVSFGMFVELDNLIEGLIKLEDLTDDYYTFDETTFSLVGRKNKRGYRLGDTLEVIVKAASKESRTIDFCLENENKGEKVKVRK